MHNDLFRIVLIEDNVADVYLFRKALLSAELHFELIIIEDGGAALTFARDEGKYSGSPIPDLAVVDLNLPKNDGLQVLKAIDQNQRFANVPVVATSSAPSLQPALEPLRITKYIPKPADLNEFLQIGKVLKEVILQNRTRRLENNGELSD